MSTQRKLHRDTPSAGPALMALRAETERAARLQSSLAAWKRALQSSAHGLHIMVAKEAVRAFELLHLAAQVRTAAMHDRDHLVVAPTCSQNTYSDGGSHAASLVHGSIPRMPATVLVMGDWRHPSMARSVLEAAGAGIPVVFAGVARHEDEVIEAWAKEAQAGYQLVLNRGLMGSCYNDATATCSMIRPARPGLRARQPALDAG